MKKISALLFALLISACASKQTHEAPRVRMGEGVKPGRAVVFLPRCEGVSGPCDGDFRSTLLGRLTSELELGGYTLLRGEELFASARERTSAGGSVDGAGPFGRFWVEAGGSVQSVVTYSDLPPAGKRALLEEARADGVIDLRVLVGEDEAPSPLYDLHRFELTARYAVGPDEEIGWVANCAERGENRDVIDGIHVSFIEAADRLARCVSDAVAGGR